METDLPDRAIHLPIPAPDTSHHPDPRVDHLAFVPTDSSRGARSSIDFSPRGNGHERDHCPSFGSLAPDQPTGREGQAEKSDYRNCAGTLVVTLKELPEKPNHSRTIGVYFRLRSLWRVRTVLFENSVEG
jgi:hypothetical protein